MKADFNGALSHLHAVYYLMNTTAEGNTSEGKDLIRNDAIYRKSNKDNDDADIEEDDFVTQLQKQGLNDNDEKSAYGDDDDDSIENANVNSNGAEHEKQMKIKINRLDYFGHKDNCSCRQCSDCSVQYIGSCYVTGIIHSMSFCSKTEDMLTWCLFVMENSAKLEKKINLSVEAAFVKIQKWLSELLKNPPSVSLTIENSCNSNLDNVKGKAVKQKIKPKLKGKCANDLVYADKHHECGKYWLADLHFAILQFGAYHMNHMPLFVRWSKDMKTVFESLKSGESSKIKTLIRYLECAKELVFKENPKDESEELNFNHLCDAIQKLESQDKAIVLKESSTQKESTTKKGNIMKKSGTLNKENTCIIKKENTTKKGKKSENLVDGSKTPQRCALPVASMVENTPSIMASSTCSRRNLELSPENIPPEAPKRRQKPKVMDYQVENSTENHRTRNKSSVKESIKLQNVPNTYRSPLTPIKVNEKLTNKSNLAAITKKDVYDMTSDEGTPEIEKIRRKKVDKLSKIKKSKPVTVNYCTTVSNDLDLISKSINKQCGNQLSKPTKCATDKSLSVDDVISAEVLIELLTPQNDKAKRDKLRKTPKKETAEKMNNALTSILMNANTCQDEPTTVAMEIDTRLDDGKKQSIVL